MRDAEGTYAAQRGRGTETLRNPHFWLTGTEPTSQPVAFAQFWLGVRRNCLSGGLRRWGGGGAWGISTFLELVHMLLGGCYASDGWVGFQAYTTVP